MRWAKRSIFVNLGLYKAIYNTVTPMRSCKQRGSSLIEVMVALFVLAIGLLGVFAMQSKSMQFNQSAYSYSQAVYLANDIAERIKNNINLAASYKTTGTTKAASSDAICEAVTCCDSSSCGVAALAEWDLEVWLHNIKNRLPQGSGTIDTVTVSGRNFLKIDVGFDDSRSGEKLDAEGNVIPDQKTYALLVEY